MQIWKSVLNFPKKMEDMKIEKFTGKNYSLWKVQMRSLLVKQDLVLTIEGKAKKPSTMSNEDWQKIDEKAMASIFLSLAKNVLFNVSNEKSTKEVWDKLQNMYQTASAANKIFIMKKLYKLKMKEGTAMSNHINDLNTLLCQASSVGMTQDDEAQAIILLCSLPDSWDPVVIAISTSNSLKSKLTYDEVVATLLSEDMRRSNKDSSSGDALTMVSTERRGRSHHRGNNNYNQRRSKSPNRSRSRGRNGECWFCSKPGHTKRNCRAYKKAQENVRNIEANTAYEKDDNALILSTSDTKSDSWVIDSGASFHATSCTDCFTNYHEGQFGEVFLGDNKSCEIIGKGDILLQLEDGGQWLLKDVHHVPKLKRNLISVSQLFAQGYYPSLHPDNWKVTKGSRIIAKGNKVGNLYLLEKPTEIGAAMTVMGSDAALWHQRLGHMSKKNLEVMLQRDQLPGLQSANLEFCEHCLYGK